MSDLYDEYSAEKFFKINPAIYAEKLKIKFKNNPKLWYDAISPKTKAQEFRRETYNDYSKIWHTHCDSCWKNIDKNTVENCYVSDDELTWLCEECYNKALKK